MALFQLKNNEAQKIKSAKAEKEKDIQTIFEHNLEALLGVRFLATEYPTSFGGRIDTLGIDKDNSPVIIEYKKTQSESIINQGLSYLKWLLDHKEAFEKLVDEKILGGFMKANPKIDKIGEIPEEMSRVDWSSPRVICVAESYNKFDLDTIDILPIKIELFEYTFYENNFLQIEQKSQEKVKIDTSGVIKNSEKNKFKKLQKDYTFEEHLDNGSKKTKDLFLKLREKIKTLDENIKEEPKKHYIAYKLNTNFTDVVIRNNDLKIFLNVKSGELNDPNKIARDLVKPKPIGHWGNGDYEAKILNEEDLEKVFDLVKQSYNYNK